MSFEKPANEGATPEEPGPRSLDTYLSEFGTSSVSKKYASGPELLKFLKENPVLIKEYHDLKNFVEQLAIHYITGQNPKVTMIGCLALGLIATALGERYGTYSETIFEKVISKLAHVKGSVRTSVREYLVKTVEVGAHTPTDMVERLIPLTSHISKDVSTESERTLMDILKISKGKTIDKKTLVDLLIAQIKLSNTNVNNEISSIFSDSCELLGRRLVLNVLEKELPTASSTSQKNRILWIIGEVKAKEQPEKEEPLKDQKEKPDLTAGVKKKVTTSVKQRMESGSKQQTSDLFLSEMSFEKPANEGATPEEPGPRSLDTYLSEFGMSSVSKKYASGPELLKFLKENPVLIKEYHDLKNFVEQLAIHYITGQNPKVTMIGCQALGLIATALGERYGTYSETIFEKVISKLAHVKGSVRTCVREYLVKTVEVGAHTPTDMVERLIPLTSHISKDVSTESERTLMDILKISKGKTIDKKTLVDLLIAQIKLSNTNVNNEISSIFSDSCEHLGRRLVLNVLEKELPTASSTSQKNRILWIIGEVKAKEQPEKEEPLKDQKEEPDLTAGVKKKVTTSGKQRMEGGSKQQTSELFSTIMSPKPPTNEGATPREEPGSKSVLDKYLTEFEKLSVSKKHASGPDLLKFLKGNPEIIKEYGGINIFVERLTMYYVTGQNPKVTVIGCQALGLIATALGARYRCYSETIFEKVISKLAHVKDFVRASVREYLVKTVEVGAHTPSEMVERLIPLTSHISKDVSTEAERALVEIITISKGRTFHKKSLINLLIAQTKLSNTNVNNEISSIISDLCDRLGRGFVLKVLEKELSKDAASHKFRINWLIEEVKAKGLSDTEDQKEEPDLASDITGSMKELSLGTKKKVTSSVKQIMESGSKRRTSPQRKDLRKEVYEERQAKEKKEVAPKKSSSSKEVKRQVPEEHKPQRKERREEVYERIYDDRQPQRKERRDEVYEGIYDDRQPQRKERREEVYEGIYDDRQPQRKERREEVYEGIYDDRQPQRKERREEVYEGIYDDRQPQRKERREEVYEGIYEDRQPQRKERREEVYEGMYKDRQPQRKERREEVYEGIYEDRQPQRKERREEVYEGMYEDRQPQRKERREEVYEGIYEDRQPQRKERREEVYEGIYDDRQPQRKERREEVYEERQPQRKERREEAYEERQPQRKERREEVYKERQKPESPMSTKPQGAIRKRAASEIPKSPRPGADVKPTKVLELKIHSKHSGKANVEADEKWFNSAFEDVPQIGFKSKKDFDNFTKKILTDLQSSQERWEQKINALQRIRSMILYGHQYQADTLEFISNLGMNIRKCLQDQRSQVVREMNLTIAYMCKKLKHLLDIHTVTMILPFLLANVSSPAKVVATSSCVTLEFLFSNIYNGKLISQLVFQMNNSKFREIVVTGAQCLLVILQEWPIDRLEPHIGILQKALRMGLNNASLDSRAAASKAFWSFKKLFPEQGNSMLNRMDSTVKKQVMASIKKSGGGVQKWQQQQPPEQPQQQPRSSRKTAPPRSSSVAPIRSVRSRSALDRQVALESQAHRQFLSRDPAEEGQESVGRQRVQDRGPYTTRDAIPSQFSADFPPDSPEMLGDFEVQRTSRYRVRQSSTCSRSRTPGFQYFTEGAPHVVEKEMRRFKRALSLSQRVSPDPFDTYRTRGMTGEAAQSLDDSQHLIDRGYFPRACMVCGNLTDKFCRNCPGQPALHPIDCFEIFHSLEYQME